MDRENRAERQLDSLIARAATPRTAAAVIATVTTTITVAAGLLMTVIDHKGFPSLGSGLWWAVQTVTTVGYGDHVPETATGQVLAAVVMLLGIGFVTVITASITGKAVVDGVSNYGLIVTAVDGGASGDKFGLRVTGPPGASSQPSLTFAPKPVIAPGTFSVVIGGS